ncbi:MAG: cytochrome c3 family protein [Phycisphaeraceae bacterium]|nr:cytochrome c3 family protein [Phycisphaeraceae bacterium]
MPRRVQALEVTMPGLFPKWTNALPTVTAAMAMGGAVTAVAGVWYYFTPKYWEAGYMPQQPGSGFNHQIHAGKLGIDCRYCHTKVEQSPEANVPNVATCMGCHTENRLSTEFVKDEKVQFIRDAYATDESIEWRRVHKLPDYVRNFPHHVHIHAGVSCYSCHGQIMGMPEVFQAEPLSMGWCLDCHRDPGKHLVEPDQVTRLREVEQELTARRHHEGTMDVDALVEALRTAPPETCGACHH